MPFERLLKRTENGRSFKRGINIFVALEYRPCPIFKDNMYNTAHLACILSKLIIPFKCDPMKRTTMDEFHPGTLFTIT